MHCPKCRKTDLGATTVQDITVDRCPDCAGIWFDERELAHLLRLTARDLKPLRGGATDSQRDEAPGDCPRHQVRMVRMQSASNSAVVLDTCLECRGIWLDGGELDALLAS